MTLDEIRGEKKALHHCERIERVSLELGECGSWGAAITECAESNEGRLIVSDGEAWNAVNFCPFCGFEAKVKLES